MNNPLYPVQLADVGCRIPFDDLEVQSNGKLGAPASGSVVTGQYLPNGWYLRNGDIEFVDCVLDGYAVAYALDAVKGEVKLTNCTIRGGKSAGLDIGSGSEVSNCLIEDTLSDGFKMGGHNLIERNFIRLLGGPNNPKAHADGIQWRGGRNNRVLRNVWDMLPEVEGPKGVYRNSHCLFLTRDISESEGHEIAYNYFRGGGYSVQFFATEGGEPSLFHSNIFERGSSLHGPYRIDGPIEVYNNRWHDGGFIEDGSEPEPEAPEEPPTEIVTPTQSAPTWKIYNADGTVTERWK